MIWGDFWSQRVHKMSEADLGWDDDKSRGDVLGRAMDEKDPSNDSIEKLSPFFLRLWSASGVAKTKIVGTKFSRTSVCGLGAEGSSARDDGDPGGSSAISNTNLGC